MPIKKLPIFIFLVLIISVVRAQNIVPDQLPTFALSDFMGLIESRITYPNTAFEANITGKVFVEFTVTQTGEVVEVKVLKGIGYGCDEEALAAIISTSGNWNPARLNGNPIPYKQTVAIKFQPRLDFQSKTEEPEELQDDTEFSFVEIEPKPPFDLQEYFYRAIRYPKKAIEKEIDGKVYVTFVISSKGKVQNVSPTKGIGYGCDEEAVRVVKEMPDWTPAIQDGKRVKCRMTIPIIFKLMRDFPEQPQNQPAASFDFQSFADNNFSPELFPAIMNEAYPIGFSFQLKKNGVHEISIKEVKNILVTKELNRIVTLLGRSILFEPDKAVNGALVLSAAIDPSKFKKCRAQYLNELNAYSVLQSGDFQKMVNYGLQSKTDTAGEMEFSFLVDTNGKTMHPIIIRSLGKKADSVLLQLISETNGNWIPPRDKKTKVLGVVYLNLYIGQESDAVPPGGDLSLFFNRNVIIPDEAKIQKMEGRLKANFIVDRTGKISGIRIETPGCCGWNEEMIRVLKLSSGLWTPKKRNGKGVFSERQLDFVFPYQ